RVRPVGGGGRAGEDQAQREDKTVPHHGWLIPCCSRGPGLAGMPRRAAILFVMVPAGPVAWGPVKDCPAGPAVSNGGGRLRAAGPAGLQEQIAWPAKFPWFAAC